jgi:CDP-glucose 4,6-dehydratase
MRTPETEALDYYRGRAVLLTGHTGFKGSWMAAWLKLLGAKLVGLALPPEPGSLFEAAGVVEGMTSLYGDIRAPGPVNEAFASASPEIVFHFAAQPFVRRSYRQPLETYATNVMGTAHVLEAARLSPSVRAVVVVTTDKCYENREWPWGYREIDRLGGHDPYSSSKACAELVTRAYRDSYASAATAPAIATVRAGNVIGGGDWGEDRLVPDIARALSAGRAVAIRNPGAIRPWQHVLEPLRGYLMLGAQLGMGRREFADAWNFGPRSEDIAPVGQLVEAILAEWGEGRMELVGDAEGLHESHILTLDWSKAAALLGWRPRLALPDTVRMTVAGYRACLSSPEAAAETMDRQIADYMALPSA